jgi:hypothetical protein
MVGKFLGIGQEAGGRGQGAGGRRYNLIYLLISPSPHLPISPSPLILSAVAPLWVVQTCEWYRQSGQS